MQLSTFHCYIRVSFLCPFWGFFFWGGGGGGGGYGLMKIYCFTFVSELIEDNEEKKELSEFEEKNHVKSGEKPKQKDVKKGRAKKSFTCTQCGKSVRNKRSLDYHMRVHTGGRPYTCDQCGKSFSQSSNLKKHMKVHSKEKPHSCCLCGKSFSRLQSLKLHERIHTGEKLYKCSHCDKRFSVSSNLKTHERIHTGEKPFTCDQCGKSFTQSSHLKDHMDIHTREKLYTCDQCGKNIFKGFKPEDTPESSYKGEATFLSFVWKEFFMFTIFKNTSENTHCCERVHVLSV